MVRVTRRLLGGGSDASLLGFVLDHAPVVLFATDAHGRLTLLEGKGLEPLGLRPGERLGEPVLDLLAGEPALPQARRALQGERVELTTTLRSGRVYSATLLPLRGRRAGQGGVAGVAVDVTPQREAAEAQRASLSLLQATLESTADGLLVVDRGGRIVVHNRRFAELWGLPDEVLDAKDDARALDAVLARVVDPAAFLARVRELYATPGVEARDVVELVDGRVLERFSRPQRMGAEVVGRVWSFRDVTARRRVEAERDRLLAEERAIRERAAVAERWLTELVHGMDAILWERRAGEAFTFVSEGGEAILGYPPDWWRAPGSWATVVHPDDLPRALSACHALEDQRLELRVRAADGRVVWIQDNVRVVRDEEGEVALRRGVMVDITARKQAEEALLASEARLRAMVECTPNVGIQRFAPDGRVLAWNPASEVIYGVSAAEAVGRRLDEAGLLRTDQALELARAFDDVTRTGRPHGPDEWTVHRPDGSLAFVLSTIFRLPGPGGDELVCMDVDVTRRRRAEEALERHAACLEAQAGVSRRLDDAALDPGAIAQALALGLHEACGCQTLLLVRLEEGGDELLRGAPEARCAPLEALARAQAVAGYSLELAGEALAARAPASGFGSVAAVPLAARGRALGALCVGRAHGAPFDAEELRLLEDLGERAAQALENARHFLSAREAIRQRDEFLSVASHELRTPLQSLGLAVQTLSVAAARAGGLGALPPEALARGLGRVERQQRRLARLVEGLLDVTRLASGQLHLELEELDLRQVVRDGVELFEDELAERCCALTLDLPDEPVTGRWDASRLEQVVVNLLSNACKYGKGLPIVLSVSAAGERARLSVHDRGIGMDAETCAQIFQRFKRGVSARHYGGLGLGLFITRQIVEALGGSVQVESRPGEGSTFSVELPRSWPGSPRAA